MGGVTRTDHGSEQPAPQQRGERSAATPQVWGQGPSGEPLHLYRLESAALRVWVSEFGGRLVRVQAPDRQGHWADLVLGHPQPEPYWQHPQASYYSAVIGRVGNRIAGGQFALGGRQFQLALNDGPNALHGGPGGFHQVTWTAAASENTLDLHYTSPSGEEGYPGTLEVQARYSLGGAALRLELSARTDAETPINLTHHPFWNLAGLGEGEAAPSVLGHQLQLSAPRYTPIDDTLIPTGELASVDATPFDFRAPRTLGERIGADHDQLHFAGGYDHNFVLDAGTGSELRHAATLSEPLSGRRLEVYTDQPGLQVYSGNFSDGSFQGWNGQRYGLRSSVCLEPQHFPDAPNQPGFPPIVLRPGEHYTWTTEYRFSVDE
jgi:aldose 1-epimerase